jgi:hypothetical protein
MFTVDIEDNRGEMAVVKFSDRDEVSDELTYCLTYLLIHGAESFLRS